MATEKLDGSFRLSDRTAVLTGPSTSLNQAIALKLTSLGTDVALLDRNAEKMQRFADQLMDQRETNENFGRALAISTDLSKPHHVADAIGKAAETFGGIDIYIDGLMTSDVRSFHDPNSLEELDRMIDVNLRAAIYMTHGVMKYLEGRKRGRIIYLMQDLVRLGLQSNSLLAATRQGLSAFARTLALETASANVTVNCVSAGLSEEFLLAQTRSSSVTVQVAEELVRKQFPGAHLIEPDRVANLVAFLASPLAAGISGQTIAVNQGLG